MTRAETASPARSTGRILGLPALAVLFVAGISYAWLHRPKASPEPPSAAAARPVGPATDAAHAQAQVDTMVQRLKERLASKPDDAEGWAMLGRSQLVLNQPEQAVAAFRKHSALKPDDADGLADLADALAFTAGRRFDGEPEQLLARALKLDPRNAKALELSGTMAFDRAQRRSGAAPAATAGARISGRVVIADTLKSRIKPDDTVLIFARLLDGPRMPVAVLKRKASELPLDFQLDDSSAMNPGLRLSPSMQVVVGARVSRSGQATPQAGDLQGFADPVPVGTKDLAITISTVVK